VGGPTAAIAALGTHICLALQIRQDTKTQQSAIPKDEDMPQFVLIMMGSASNGDWETYVDKLVGLGKLRGGSSLAKGLRISKGGVDSDCAVSGYIRLEVADIEKAKSLLIGNPLYEAGGVVEILEEVSD